MLKYHIQIIFKKIEIFLSTWPLGNENFNSSANSSYNFDLFETNFFYMSDAVLIEVTYRSFQITHLNFFNFCFFNTAPIECLGAKTSKRFSYSYEDLATKLFLHVPYDSPHRS